MEGKGRWTATAIRFLLHRRRHVVACILVGWVLIKGPRYKN
jgi:hypothetical protein